MIAIDFDGTVTTNDYPEIGKGIGAVPVLRELLRRGHKLILLTNRTDRPLAEAVAYLQDYGIELFGINRNPIQWKFSKSPKVYADLYIDDLSLGCPLKRDETLSPKPFVDWDLVRAQLEERGVL